MTPVRRGPPTDGGSPSTGRTRSDPWPEQVHLEPEGSGPERASIGSDSRRDRTYRLGTRGGSSSTCDTKSELACYLRIEERELEAGGLSFRDSSRWERQLRCWLPRWADRGVVATAP